MTVETRDQIAELHAKTVETHGLGACVLVESRGSGWPYDCPAKRDHPDALVTVCESHGAWWWTW